MTEREIIDMMGGEFKAACAEIDRRADEAVQESLRSAFSALLDNDTAKRDRLCAKAERVDEVARKAKVEAWLRIGEKYGLDRDKAEEALKKNASLQ